MVIHQQNVGARSGQLPQLVGEAARTEQNEPVFAVRLFPRHALCLLLQIMQDVQAHRLLPELALAEDQVDSLRIERGNVDLCIAVPPAPDPGEVEGPGVLGVQVPHLFPAHVLIDKGSMTGYETLADLVQHDPAVAAFDKAHIGIDEGKPEADIVILAEHLSHFAQRSHSLEQVHLDILQICGIIAL